MTYNHERYIDNCLSSVVSQQVDADLEILVGDDCSTDRTREIVLQYANRYPNLVIPIFHEKNLGGGSFNYDELISKATGDYIAHLDGDDFWLPGKLTEQFNFLEQNTNCSAVYTNAIVVNESGHLLARFNGLLPKQFDLNYLLAGGNFLNASSVMYRSEFKGTILQVKKPMLDYQYHILLTKHGLLGYINATYVGYRLNSTTSVQINRFEAMRNLYWDSILRGWAMGAGKAAVQTCIIGFYRSLLRTAIVRRKYAVAWAMYKRTVNECPLATRGLLLRSALTLPIHGAKAAGKGLARRMFKGGAEILFDR